jgi:hypothetical protein
LRHTIPSGDPAAIVDRALTTLLRELERQRCAATALSRNSRPLTDGSRHIPAAVKREVWRRDDGRCAFVGRNGRCSERGFLEFHHVQPYAAGGAATAENVQLRLSITQCVRSVAIFRMRRSRSGPGIQSCVRNVFTKAALPRRSVIAKAGPGEPDDAVRLNVGALRPRRSGVCVRVTSTVTRAAVAVPSAGGRSETETDFPPSRFPV